MANYVPSKKLEECLSKIELLEEKLSQYIKESTEKTAEREYRLTQIIAEQREEIVRLRKEFDTERKDRQARRIRAENKLRSE